MTEALTRHSLVKLDHTESAPRARMLETTVSSLSMGRPP
jgi:hypothetical protein